MQSTWIEEAPAPSRAPAFLGPLRRLYTPGRLLLCAVASVVVLVSLPLLRSLALRSNELDALRALDLLGREVFAGEAGSPSMAQLFRPDAELTKRLPDRRLLAQGRLMFHHGYLFEVVASDSGKPVLHAWPLAHGQTGLGAFSSAGPGELLGHPNRSARWSGIGGAPSVPARSTGADSEASEDADGWRPIQISATRSAGM